jgi:hypothetical protein
MQLLGARGEPYTDAEWAALRNYCTEDTTDLADLFLAMRGRLDLLAAVVRARYMIVKGQQRYRGIPIDADLIARYQAERPRLRQMMIDATPDACRYYPAGQFRESLFCGWAAEEGIGLVRRPDGKTVLDRNTLREVTLLDPRLAPFARLRSDLSLLEGFSIDVRSDGRIRPNFWPLGTRTGRDRPKASEYPMLQAKWTRGCVLAPPGRALAQVDFKAEEIYIAAAMSKDGRLLEDLETDPYLLLAVDCGFAPPGATNRTHNEVRNMFKPVLLGLIYGEGERKLASELHVDVARAREIRAGFRRRYRVLWQWLEAVVDAAYTTRYLESPLGWPLRVGPLLDRYTLRNHLIQAAGSDVLRAACLFAQDAGLMTIATLHDAILQEADADQIESRAAILAREMTRAAEHVIGIPIPTEIEFTAQRFQLKEPHASFFEEVCRRLDVPKAIG